MRTFYANSMDKMYVPWAVEGLPTLLQLILRALLRNYW